MSEIVTGTAARISTHPLFSYGFRPFFLGAGAYALAVMALWFGWMSVGMPDWALFGEAPIAWHAHEMIFGFAAAAVGGFLLTAVPNWTGALPLSGLPLMLLFAAWLIGRAAMLGAGWMGPVFSAILDLVFLPLLGVAATRQLFVKPAPRNLIFLAMLAALFGANVAYHLATSGVIPGVELDSLRFALILLVLMIAIVGGRVIPAFTHNWLHLNRASAPMPRRIPWLDGASISTIAALAVLQVLPAADEIQGGIALLAALANGVRLYFWRGVPTWRAPIVFVLHVSYAWIVIGLVLLSAAAFGPGLPSIPAEHAFGAGAVASMIMSIMTRASLGHTGRPLIAPRPVVLGYLLLTLAALLRVFGSMLFPAQTIVILQFAGLSWIAAFGLFVAVYAPILMMPRRLAGGAT